MEGFLTFLSNNYLYFLIAAGVLLFALIGLLVDVKKKKESEVVTSNENIPNVTPTVEEPVVSQTEDIPTLNDNQNVTFTPEPPMPEENLDSNTAHNQNVTMETPSVGYSDQKQDNSEIASSQEMPESNQERVEEFK